MLIRRWRCSESAGITCEEMKDKDSRKLIFVNEESEIKVFPGEGTGCADLCRIWCRRYRCGRKGYDRRRTGRSAYEVLDLGIWKMQNVCLRTIRRQKICWTNQELIRVATKYPKIAKDYFYNKKHQTVEIIKMNGSIELAPIVGLSEVIVDIVETGIHIKGKRTEVLGRSLSAVCPNDREIQSACEWKMSGSESDRKSENHASGGKKMKIERLTAAIQKKPSGRSVKEVLTVWTV